MTKRNTSKPKGRVFDSMTQCAGAIGLSVDVLRFAKGSGCRAFRPGGRIHATELRNWIRTHPHTPKTANAVAYERARLLRGQAERIERENAAALGKLVPADVVERDLALMSSTAAGTLKRIMTEELPPLLEGLSAPAILVELKKAYARVCELLHNPATYQSEPPVVDPPATPTTIATTPTP